MTFRGFRIAVCVALLTGALAQTAPAPAKQNPSPMTDTTRAHQRIEERQRAGRRMNLSLGTLFLPQNVDRQHRVPLVVHFHGAAWLAEVSAEEFDARAAVLAVHLGSGSGVYGRAFSNPARFRELLDEASRAMGANADVRFDPVILTGFSAGYGAIREILRSRDNWRWVSAVVLADGLHTDYVPDGTPGPLNGEPLQPFVDFAREALAGHKRMLITHSEIFPGTFASTTECTDYLIGQLALRRRPVLRWGPVGMQQVSEARSGGLRILGFAGNTGPDHVDHFHALGRWLKLVSH